MALADRVAERTRTRRPPVAPGQAQRATTLWSTITEDFATAMAGGSTHNPAGAPVDFGSVNGVTAWYSGARYLSETMASIPVRTFRRRGLGPSAFLESRSDPPWYRSGDLEQTWFGLIEHWMMSLIHAGNAYAWKLRNPVGQVVALREVHPRRVTPGVAPDGTKRFRIDLDQREYTARDVLHIPGLAYDGRVGLNPLRAHAASMGAVIATDEYAGRFFGQGTHVGGLISVPQPLTDTQRRDMMAEWDAFHKGLAQAHQTGVLGNGATYNKLALNAEDAQLIESRTYGVLEVARILRIPPHKLYELSRATFSNIEHQSIEAVQDSINPWCRRIEAYVNHDPDLLPGSNPDRNFIQFDTVPLLQGDTQSTTTALMSASGGPFMTRNEARRRVQLEPLDGLDDMLEPLAMGVVGEEPEPPPAPPGKDDEGDPDE